MERAASFCRKSDGISSALAYILLRMALYREYGIIKKPLFEFGENKKPYLKDRRDIFFSLSHCADAVMCAAGSTEVGADIQDYNEKISGFSDMILHHEEAEMIKSVSCPEREMICLWSIKEAYGKYCGTGILYELTDISFAGITEGGWQRFRDAYIISLKLDYDAVSVCSGKPITFCHISDSDIIKFSRNIQAAERMI